MTDIYFVCDDCGTEIFTDEYDTEQEAIEAAERAWNRLTTHDKNRRKEFYIGRGSLDNHDVIKRWK